jgi:hypothetical protein
MSINRYAEDQCRNEQSQTHIRTQGGIEAVVTAMRRHAENAKLQEAACGALWVLAANDEIKARIDAQVESIHEYICEYMWPSHGRRSKMSQRAIANTHTHAGGD